MIIAGHAPCGCMVLNLNLNTVFNMLASLNVLHVVPNLSSRAVRTTSRGHSE